MEAEVIDTRTGWVAFFIRQYLGTIVVAACGLLFLKVFMEWLRKYLILKNIPGPDDSFPPSFLINTMRPRMFTTGAKDVTHETSKVLSNVIDTYADPDEGICKIYLGFSPMVLLSRAQSAEAILSDNVNLSKPMVYQFLDAYVTNSLLTSTGEFWRFQRKLLTPAFHFKILDDFMGIFNKHAANFVVYLNALPLSEEIRLFRETSKVTISVIGETSLGHDVKAMVGDNFYGKALTILQVMCMMRAFRPWMWLDAYYYKFTHEGAVLKQAIKAMHGLSTRILEIKMDERKEQELKKDRTNDKDAAQPEGRKKIRTFIEILLDSHEQNPELVTKKLIRTGVDTMLFAGQDTTATTMSWIMYLLGDNPDIQEKCRQEVFRILGPDPTAHVSSEQLKELRYLDAAVKESMRVYAPIPIMGRQLDTDIKVKVNGKVYTIPAGVQVFTSIFHIHRDPQFFPDPEKFDPERFLDENAPHKAHPFSYLPFSGGPRNCIGQKFALMELKVVMAHLLRNFKWTSTRPRDQLKLCYEIVLRAKGDLRVKMEPLRPTQNVETAN